MDVVKLLLKAGANPYYKNKANNNNNSYIHAVIYYVS